MDELDLLVQTEVLRKINQDLGIKAGRIRFSRQGKLIATPRLSPQENEGLKAWVTRLTAKRK